MDFDTTILFWLIVAALLIALLMLLLPALLASKAIRNSGEAQRLNTLVYQDQLRELDRDLKRGVLSKADYDSEVQDIERRVIEDSAEREAPAIYKSPAKTTAFALVAFVPALALGAYFMLGNPTLINYNPRATEGIWGADGKMSAMEGASPSVFQLEKYLKESPRDVRAWILYSRELYQRKRYQEALLAMDEAFKYSPDKVAKDPELMTERAVLMLETQDKELEVSAVALLDAAMEADPSFPQPKQIAALLAYQRQQYRRAEKIWTALYELYPPNSSNALQLLDAIASARNNADMMGEPK